MAGRDSGRRDFTLRGVLAILGGASISFSGCRENGSMSRSTALPLPPSTAPPAQTPMPVADRTGTFVANHGHAAVITGAVLMAGSAVLLNIRGTANHPHTLELSAEEMAAIALGLPVAKQSTEEKGHTHYVRFN